MKRILMISIIVVSVLAIASCSSTPVKKENAESTIQPTGNYEDCADAKPGQVISYSFTTSMPVDFNIHYHADKIYYPVDKKGISSDSGTYEPEKEDIYCLMWTNTQGQPVSLKYNFVIENKTSPAKTGY